MFEYKIGDLFKCTHAFDIMMDKFEPGDIVELREFLTDLRAVDVEHKISAYNFYLTEETLRDHFIPIKRTARDR